jgi:hypothetical protein
MYEPNGTQSVNGVFIGHWGDKEHDVAQVPGTEAQGRRATGKPNT